MKIRHLIAAVLPLICTGCGFTHIVTTYPSSTNSAVYSTTVTAPRTAPVTTTRVVAASEDISLGLDLQAVAAAFAQSATVRDFETLLNDRSYMLNNLDLNGDGYIDYLRVMETVEGYNHLFVIQAALGANIYQDVATVVAELPSVATATVQVIGAPYIYGPNYIIQPTFVATPLIFAHLMRPVYTAWSSPWFYGYYPSCYRRVAPVYVNHYQAYVSTYMGRSTYCRQVTRVTVTHYTKVEVVTRNVCRNDYGRQHPEKSYSSRSNAQHRQPSQAARPAQQRQGDVSRRSDQSHRSDVSGRPQQGRSDASAQRPAQQRQGQASQQRSSQQGRSQATQQRSAQQGRSQATQQRQTTVKSRVSNSGSSTTKVRTTNSSSASSSSRRSGSTGSRSSSASSSHR